MKKGLPWLALFLAGCGRSAPYEEVFQAQVDALEETARILATVKDEASMTAARAALDSRREEFADTSRKAQELPPPPAWVVERLQQKRASLEAALGKVQIEVRRIRALPGGETFLEQWQNTPSLP